MKYVIIEDNAIVKIINENQPFEYNGVNYPSNWLQLATEEEKQQINVFPVIEETKPNAFFYENIIEQIELDENNIPKLKWVVTEKPLSEIKNNLIQILKNRAYRILQQTDWYIVRFIETGTLIPSEIQQQRNAVRENTTEQETRINNATSIQELIDLEIV